MGWQALRERLPELEAQQSGNQNGTDRRPGSKLVTLGLAASFIQHAQQAHVHRKRGALSQLAELERQNTPVELAERTLFCLTATNPVRSIAVTLTSHRFYESFTLILILASCTTLAMDSTREDFPSTGLGRSLTVLEYTWAGLMCAELSVRVVARGLVIPKSAILRSGWGMLDVLVVALGFLNLVPGANNYSAVRAFRVLRPLRAVSRLPDLKVLVVTLLTALPMLLHVVILCGLVYFAYGIVAITAFAGTMRNSCGVPDFSAAYAGVEDGRAVLLNVTYTVTDAEADQVCRGPKLRDPGWLLSEGTNISSAVPEVYSTQGGRQCKDGMYCVVARNPNYDFMSFDNILWAWLTIFQCITQEGWTDVMYYLQDGLSYWVWPFFITLIVFGSFLIINLALVVLYVQFSKSEAAVRNQILEGGAQPAGGSGHGENSSRWEGSSEEEDAEEKEKAQEQKPEKKGFLARMLPSFSEPSDVPLSPGTAQPTHGTHPHAHHHTRPPLSRLRHWLGVIARSKHLTSVTIVAIVVNTVVMCINWYGIPPRLEHALDIVNMALTVYFVAELAVRVGGLGCRRYFSDGMSVFDAGVVVASVVEVMVELVPSPVRGVGPLSVLRTLRFLRLMRLATRWTELRKVIRTLLKSVSSVAWMSLLMLLFIIIAALLGMQIFGFAFQFCDYVPGAAPACPLGQRVWGDCPRHFHCYLPCGATQAGSWLPVAGSRFFGHAYCQRFCEDGSFTGDRRSAGTNTAVVNGSAALAPPPPGVRCEYLAAVGKSDVPLSTFDDFGAAMLTVFGLITGEDWNIVMYNGMRSRGPGVALFFVAIIVLGNYVVLNLFIAILLENFAAHMDDGDGGGITPQRGGTGDEDEDEDVNALKRTPSFLKAEMDADRQWYKQTFGISTVHPVASDNSIRDGGEGKDRTAAGREAAATASKTQSAAAYFEAQMQLHRMESERKTKLSHEEFMKGISLWLFDTDSAFRWRCMMMVTWKWFDYIILGFIAASSISLAIDSPKLEEEQPDMSRVLRYLDYAWSGVFIIEALLKIVAFGFLLNGRASYLRDPWNILDFAVVLASVTTIVLEFALPAQQQNLAMLRALRTLRALRPLRIASSSEQLKTVINALLASLRSLVYVGMVCVLFYLLFGILGVNLLKGQLRYCADAATGALLDSWYLLPPGQAINRTWCAAGGGAHAVTTSAYHAPLGVALPAPAVLATQWVKPARNFDHLGASMVTLFGVATTELWIDTTARAVAAVGPEQQPVAGHHPWTALFFVAFLIVGSFLVLNLLVAITIDKFSEHQARSQGYSLFLTPAQQAWVDVQRVLYDTRPERVAQRPDGASPLRLAAYDLALGHPFQMVMYGIVLANIAFMTLAHADAGPVWQELQHWADLVFAVAFAAEAVLQIYGLGPVTYFRDSWYVMLFVIAVASIVSTALEFCGVGSVALAPLLRVLRVTRFLRILTAVEGLQRLVRTLVLALPAIVNVGSVMLLFFFIWAVLGMNLWAGVKHGEYLNAHNNFQDWPSAMMVLFRTVTGEQWNGCMADLSITARCVLLTANATSPATGQALAAGSYWDPGDQAISGLPPALLDNRCSPSPLLAVLYFVSFELLCSYIIINIVVAVILEGMINEEADELLPVPQSNVEQFVRVWSELDPPASGYLPARLLPVLIMELDPPLGNRGCPSMRSGAQDIICSVDIPNRGNKLHFLEVLHALAGRTAGCELPDVTEDKVYARLARRLPAEPPHPVYTAAHFHAAAHVGAAIRGFLWRYEWREKLQDFYAQLAEGGQDGRDGGEGKGCRSLNGAGTVNGIGSGSWDGIGGQGGQEDCFAGSQQDRSVRGGRGWGAGEAGGGAKAEPGAADGAALVKLMQQAAAAKRAQSSGAGPTSISPAATAAATASPHTGAWPHASRSGVAPPRSKGPTGQAHPPAAAPEPSAPSFAARLARGMSAQLAALGQGMQAAMDRPGDGPEALRRRLGPRADQAPQRQGRPPHADPRAQSVQRARSPLGVPVPCDPGAVAGAAARCMTPEPGAPEGGSPSREPPAATPFASLAAAAAACPGGMAPAGDGCGSPPVASGGSGEEGRDLVRPLSVAARALGQPWRLQSLRSMGEALASAPVPVGGAACRDGAGQELAGRSGSGGGHSRDGQSLAREDGAATAPEAPRSHAVLVSRPGPVPPAAATAAGGGAPTALQGCTDEVLAAEVSYLDGGSGEGAQGAEGGTEEVVAGARAGVASAWLEAGRAPQASGDGAECGGGGACEGGGASAGAAETPDAGAGP